MQSNRASLAGGSVYLFHMCLQRPEIPGVVASDNVVEPGLESNAPTSGAQLFLREWHCQLLTDCLQSCLRHFGTRLSCSTLPASRPQST